ncbi:hypothetical protein [Aureibaculum conchae]|uniref:hypothetical protein n=1 Tax=Aureibaculum sp. 2308TA14-22 TaxID=3108392 RepID=UPI003398D47C
MINPYFLVAGILAILLGLIHSFLGEYLIFHKFRKKGNLVPSMTVEDIKERHLRIIWATWHLTSVFGWCLGAVYIKISFGLVKPNSGIVNFLIQSSIYTMFVGALLVLMGTKGKHPGWIVLLLIGVLLLLGN